MLWKTAALVVALSAQNGLAVPSGDLEARQFAQSAMMRFQCSQLVIVSAVDSNERERI